MANLEMLSTTIMYKEIQYFLSKGNDDVMHKDRHPPLISRKYWKHSYFYRCTIYIGGFKANCAFQWTSDHREVYRSCPLLQHCTDVTWNVVVWLTRQLGIYGGCPNFLRGDRVLILVPSYKLLFGTASAFGPELAYRLHVAQPTLTDVSRYLDMIFIYILCLCTTFYDISALVGCHLSL